MLYVKKKKYTTYGRMMEMQLEKTQKGVYYPKAALSTDGFHGKQIPEVYQRIPPPDGSGVFYEF
jgi:hypothetical protein